MKRNLDSLPVFPTTYAEKVVDHAHEKGKRGRQPSMPFLDEKNPRKALKTATATVAAPDGVIRDCLRNLREHLPGQTEVIYKFGEFLADYVNGELVPHGFIMGATLALYDLENGVNGFTGKPINHPLVGQSPFVYLIIQKYISEIARAIFPADFAGIVQEVVDEINEEIAGQKK